MIANPDGNLHIFFLNVGQADTTVIVSPEGRVVVIDAKNPSKIIDLLDMRSPIGPTTSSAGCARMTSHRTSSKPRITGAAGPRFTADSRRTTT